MRISDVLRVKGNRVVTLPPEAPVSNLVDLLTTNKIGAMVVSSNGKTVLGIVSERDVVRALAEHGPELMHRQVSDIMTADVVTCEPQASLVELLGVMTERRFRHVPVLIDGELSGLVSIGDLVKFRIDELRLERDLLETYIST